MLDAISAKKRDVTLEFLQRGNTYVHLLPRHEGSRVPSWLRLQEHLTFVIGNNLPIPIDDLEVNDSGISGTLSFSGSFFHCVMPWGAIFAISDETGTAVTWEYTRVAEPPAAPSETKPKKKPRRAIPSYLRVIQ